MAVGAVVCLLNNLTAKPTWKECKEVLSRNDFIQQVLNFDKDSINKKTKQFILDNYLNTPEWDTEKVYKASKAAGPMAEWVKSIVDYADIFLKIEPL